MEGFKIIVKWKNPNEMYQGFRKKPKFFQRVTPQGIPLMNSSMMMIILNSVRKASKLE